jgi:hypothetical protein
MLKQTKIISLACLLGSGASAQQAPEIKDLYDAASVIEAQVTLGAILTLAATDYANEGNIIADAAFEQAHVTSTQLTTYNDAVDVVAAMDFSAAENASDLFKAEYDSAMIMLGMSVDDLTAASATLMAASVIASKALTADTRPESLALQNYLSNIEITEEDRLDYNNALDTVGVWTQLSGAYLTASNNESLTTSIDNYASTNSIVVGNYSSVEYNFVKDEYLITWEGEGTGWTQYTASNQVSAVDLYDYASAYTQE